MLIGPLARKRVKKISITRRDGADDDAGTTRILPSSEESETTIDAVVIPVISDDVLLPGGPVVTTGEFVAYIDDLTELRSGDTVKISGEKDLYIIGAFPGEISQRIDLTQSRNFTRNA